MDVGADLRFDILQLRHAANRLDGADPAWCAGTAPDRLLVVCSSYMARTTWSDLDVVVAVDGENAVLAVGRYDAALGRWPRSMQPLFQGEPGAWAWEGWLEKSVQTSRWRRATAAEWASVAAGEDPWPEVRK